MRVMRRQSREERSSIELPQYVIDLREKRLNKKTCKRCGISKSYYEFHYNGQQSDKAHPYCKECRSKEKKIWDYNNKERIKKYNDMYYESIIKNKIKQVEQ